MIKKPIAVSIAFVVAVGTGILAGVFAASGAETTLARSEGPETYVLGDFTIQYPFVDHSGGTDPNQAGVTYSAAWRSQYPGEVPCTITLTDDGGNVVGVRSFSLSSAQPMAEAEETFRPVAVSGRPAAASGSCESVAAPSGQGYEFGPVAIKDGDERGTAELRYAVSWAGTESPGERMCTITVVSDDGTTTSVEVGIYIADPTGTFYWDVPVAADKIATTSIDCAPPSRG